MARSRVISFDFVLVELFGLALSAGAVLYFGKEMRGYVFGAFGLVVCLAAAVWKTRPAARPLTPPSQTTFLKKSEASPAALQRPARALTAAERLSALDWYQFKRLVAALYEQKSYAIRRSNGHNDLQGIDFTLMLGTIELGVVCKHWKSWIVGAKHIEDFVHVLQRAGLSHGRFVAFKGFSGDAQALAAKSNIQLVDGSEIARMMGEVNWAGNPALLAVMEEKKKLCPLCNSEMFVKTCREGTTAGQEIWECRTAPLCRGALVSD